jgi:pimeloyl-ACP methyl ester carboxylesterase
MKDLKSKQTMWSVPFLALVMGICLTCAESPKNSEDSQEYLEKAAAVDPEVLKSRLTLETEQTEEEGKVSKGTFKVYENREGGEGRMIELKVVILHATGDEPRPDPVFFFAGGPGQGAADLYKRWLDASYREKRDVVVINQRGTGGDNHLQISVGTDDDLQTYLDSVFQIEAYRTGLKELEKKYDLSMYSTSTAMDDINEARIALGYDQINIMGGSYGTRACLVYMRRHPETVRTAVLNGVAPIAFHNPLYHPYGAQRALDLVLQECAEDPECSQAFPNVEGEFHAVMDRLKKAPAEVTVTHPVNEDEVTLKVSWQAFAETLRMMMYSVRGSRSVPLYVHNAFAGDLSPIANQALRRNRALFKTLAMGMLLCVTCSEDIPYIDPEEIPTAVGDSFFGDFRIKDQMAICEIWPKSKLPKNYGDDVSVPVPTLLLSGTIDAVTPPRWGEEAASHLPNSLHVVAAGAHGVMSPCIAGLIDVFHETASVEGLDTSCVEDMTLPPFNLE